MRAGSEFLNYLIFAGRLFVFCWEGEVVGVVRAILYYTITSYVGTSVLYVTISYTLLLVYYNLLLVWMFVVGIEVGEDIGVRCSVLEPI